MVEQGAEIYRGGANQKKRVGPQTNFEVRSGRYSHWNASVADFATGVRFVACCGPLERDSPVNKREKGLRIRD